MIYISLAIFIIFLIRSIYRKQWPVSTYVLSVYVIMLIFASILSTINNVKHEFYFNDSMIAGGLFTALIIMCILPYCKKTPHLKFEKTKEANQKIILIGSALSIMLIMGMVFLSPYVLKAISFGLANTREVMYSGGSIINEYNTIGHIGHSILRWFGWLGYINLVFFFYSIINIRKKKLFKMALLLSSFSSIWIGLLNGGRTYIIYWILFFILCVVIFYKEMRIKKKKQIFIIIPAIILVIGSIFSFITNERVRNSSWYDNTENFIISYAGQSYPTFITYFENCTKHSYTFGRVLPITTTIIGNKLDLNEYRKQVYEENRIEINGFSTFLGDIYIDLGLLGMIIFVIIYSLLSRRITKNSEINIEKLIYICILLQVPLFGVFYYSYYRVETMVSVLIAIAIARFIGHNRHGRNKYIKNEYAGANHG